MQKKPTRKAKTPSPKKLQAPLPEKEIDRENDLEDAFIEEPTPRKAPPRSSEIQWNKKLCRGYCVQTIYDDVDDVFRATVLEFPDLEVSAPTLEDLLNDVSIRIEDEIYDLEGRGLPVPEPIQTKEYPPDLMLAISQGLFRKLDQLSRQEKISLEDLAVEILSTGIGERLGKGKRPGQPGNHQSHSQQSRGGGHHNNRHSRRNAQGSRGGRGYNETAMGSRENFIDYVRKLEKGDNRGGGGGGGWRK